MRWHIAKLMLCFLLCPAFVWGQEFPYAAARVDRLEDQVAERVAWRAGADRYEARVLEAGINVRIIARALLEAGAGVGTDGAVAMLYGHALADHIEMFESLFARLPEQIKAAADSEGDLDEAWFESMLTLDRALERFNREAEEWGDSLRGAEADQVDAYLQRMLSPLAAVVKAAGGEEPVIAWPVAAPEDSPSGPGAWAVHEILERAARMTEELEGAEHLADQTAADLREQLDGAASLIQDRRTVQAGLERVETAGRTLDVAERLAELDRQAVPVEHLRRLLRRSHEMRSDHSEGGAAGQLLDFLHRFSGLMLAYRDLLGEPAPDRFGSVLRQLRGEHQRAERMLLNRLPELLASPAAVGDGEWDEELDRLEASLGRVRRVYRVPEWIERLSRFQPRPAGGLFRHLRGFVRQMSDAQTRPAGDEALRRLEEQIAAFDPLPFEQRLAGPDAADEMSLLIAERIERLREEWAAAWATGMDDGPVVDRLEAMARLLRVMEATAGLADAERAAERLNGWAAWRVRPRTVEPLLRALVDHMDQARRSAAFGRWPAFAESLDRAEAEGAVPLLIARLDGAIGDELARLPTGVEGVLSQCLYPPGEDAYGVEHRVDLARISVYLLEADHARSGDYTDRRQDWLTRAGRIARDLNRAPGNSP